MVARKKVTNLTLNNSSDVDPSLNGKVNSKGEDVRVGCKGLNATNVENK